MDSFMVIEGIVAFIVYLVLLIIVFRLTNQDDAARWTVKLYCFVGAILCLWSEGQPPIAVGSFLIYSGLSAVYVLCIFSVIEASLTLRILSEIEYAGKNGLAYRILYSQYTRTAIVQKRIMVFLRSRDLIYRKGLYYRTDRLTIFKFRDDVITVFKQLFPEQ